MSEESAPMGEATPAPAPSVIEAQTPEAPPEDKGPSYEDRLTQRLDELSGTNTQLMEQFQALAQRFEQPEEEDDPYSLTEDDEGYEEQEARRLLDEMVNERVQQALTPIQERQMLKERDDAYNALVQKFPEMDDQTFASGIVQAAAKEAEDIGLDLNSPKFVRLVELHYKAHVADNRAAQETPAGGKEISLESGAGAAPQDRDEEIQDRMGNASVDANFLI